MPEPVMPKRRKSSFFPTPRAGQIWSTHSCWRGVRMGGGKSNSGAPAKGSDLTVRRPNRTHPRLARDSSGDFESPVRFLNSRTSTGPLACIRKARARSCLGKGALNSANCSSPIVAAISTTGTLLRALPLLKDAGSIAARACPHEQKVVSAT